MATQTVFKTPVDIANRACQHTGARRIVSFTDSSVQAAEIAACYDTLRQSELQRNVWGFSITVAALRPVSTTTMRWTPEPWANSVTYPQGAVVRDSNGALWSSRVAGNLNNSPGAFGGTAWDTYCGSTVANAYDSTVSYYNGELVYTTDSAGHYTVYISAANANTTAPNEGSPWSASVSYSVGDVVTYNGFYYVALFSFNLGNEPDQSADPWQSGINYVTADKVTGINGLVYYALQDNTGQDPTLDITHTYWGTYGQMSAWAPNFAASTVPSDWILSRGTLAPLAFTYPLGSGPIEQSSSRNVFVLPNGYLRTAPQDPKAGGVSYLGAPSNLQYTDWEYQDDCIVSRTSSVIVLRFAGDVTLVPRMNVMFCEGLGARIGYEVCERITQSGPKAQGIAAAYTRFMGEARTINAIEQGPTEPPLDDLLACRI